MVCQHTTIEAPYVQFVQFGPSIVLSVPRPLVIQDSGKLKLSASNDTHPGPVLGGLWGSGCCTYVPEEEAEKEEEEKWILHRNLSLEVEIHLTL